MCLIGLFLASNFPKEINLAKKYNEEFIYLQFGFLPDVSVLISCLRVLEDRAS